MQLEFSGTFLVLALLGWGAYLVYQSKRRSAQDVCLDLEQAREQIEKVRGSITDSTEVKSMKLLVTDELGTAGLFEAAERKRYLLTQKLIPLVFAAVVVLARSLIFPPDFAKSLAAAIFSLSLGYLIARNKLVRDRARYNRELEFYLPIVMERIVMAVQAGLDVIAALKRVIELEKLSDQDLAGKKRKLDPVTRLLEMVCQLSEAGLGFEDALSEVASLVQCTAIKHAFVHLAMAYEEGGELVMPLMELSDSTQLYYQESVEEQIAKMPVKATAPLVLTFCGLLMFFLVSPMIQVLKVVGNSSANLEQGAHK